MAKVKESVGLEGARILGDRKVASLLQFSWSARHDSTAGGSPAAVSRGKAHGESSLHKKRPQTKGRGSK
jgi:hypothetical protein